MREIGSEFWKPYKPFVKENETIYQCGRTALDMIIKDAIVSFKITSILMPSYCCHTMLEPIVKNGLKLRFYDIFMNQNGYLEIDVPEPKNNEMILVLKYFGGQSLKNFEQIDLTAWSASVEDMTHSCFSEEQDFLTDYSFASYRKWFAVDGIAIARKKNGRLRKPNLPGNDFFCQLRNQGYSLKYAYMNGEAVQKQQFLECFTRANDVLASDYSDKAADINSVVELTRFTDNIADVREARRQNAATLLEGCRNIAGQVRPLVAFNAQESCPLFFPVGIQNGQRDVLRKYLISNEIYCPVHWSISELHDGISSRARAVYENELSLICDQRYTKHDMFRILEVIHSFYKT